jgi:hypothetical protein
LIIAAAIGVAGLAAACGPAESPGGEGSVYLDRTDIILRESYPVQAALIVAGSLPTPCHELHTEVAGPDEEGRILVTISSEADPSEVCIQVLEPFETTVELGTYTQGSFSVWVNGQPVGEIDL